MILTETQNQNILENRFKLLLDFGCPYHSWASHFTQSCGRIVALRRKLFIPSLSIGR